MSGNQKTNLGVNVAFGSSGADDVANKIKLIQGAMKDAQTAFTEFNSSLKGIGSTSFGKQLTKPSTDSATLSKNLESIVKSTGSLSQVNLSTFAKGLNDLGSSEFFNDVKTNIKSLELALGDGGAFSQSIKQMSGYFDELGKIEFPENLAKSIESISGGQREVQLKVFVSTSGVQESLAQITSVSTSIETATNKIRQLTGSLNELGEVKKALGALASTLGNVQEKADLAGDALYQLNKDLVGSQNAGAQIDAEAKSIEGVGTNANAAAVLLERMGQKASKSAKDATHEVGLLGRQLHLIRSYVEGIIAYKFLGGMSEEIGKAAEQANKLQEAFVRIQLSGNKISQTDFSQIVTSQSEKFGVAPSDEAEALIKAYQLGAKSAAEAQNDLTSANQVAIITNQKLSDSLSTILEIYNVYKDTGVSVAHVSDLIAKSTLTSSANFDDYNKVLSEVVPIAKQAGISLDQVFASFSTLASSGNLTSNQIYGLPAFFSSLISPTEQQVTAMQNLGIATGQTAIKTEGLGRYLEEILKKTQGNKTLVAEVLGDAPGKTANATVFFDLVNNFMQTYKQNLDAMNSANGTAADAANKLLETNAKVFATFGASFSNLGANILTTLQNDILPAIQGMTDLTNSVNDAITAAKSLPSTSKNQSVNTGSLSQGLVNAYESGDYLAELKNLPAQIGNVLSLGVKNIVSGTVTGKIYLEDGSSIGPGGQKFDASGNLISKKGVTQTVPVKQNVVPITKGNAVLPPSGLEQLDQAQDQNAQNLVKSLQQQAATFGQTSIQVMKYRETMGDLKGASEQTKEQLMDLTKTIFLQQQAMTVFDNFTDAFNSFAEGSETAKQAFQDFARTTIEQLIKMGIQYEIFKAIDPMAAGAGGFFSSAASGAASNAISSAPGLLGGSLSPSAYSPGHSNLGSTGPINVTSHVTVNAGNNADPDEIAKKTTESVHKSLRSTIQMEIVNQMKPNGLFRRAG